MGRFLSFKVAFAPCNLVQNGIRIFKYDDGVVVLVVDASGNEENVILTRR